MKSKKSSVNATGGQQSPGIFNKGGYYGQTKEYLHGQQIARASK